MHHASPRKPITYWGGNLACVSLLLLLGAVITTRIFQEPPLNRLGDSRLDRHDRPQADFVEPLSLERPLSPVEERASFQLSDPNLLIELVAAEPDLRSPVALAWDADGRLFVAEMIGYPMSDGQCRIGRLEDLQQDGQYRRTATFAEGLSYVTSVLPFRRGLLVLAAPDLLYLEDTDGDGVADLKEVKWTGFGTGSQQLRANSLHTGLDNWIYGANGRCDGEIRRPDDPTTPPISLRGRDFRFSPATGQFESLLGQSQFGQVHDDWGHRFLSWNTIPIRQVLLDEPELGGDPSAASRVVVNLADPADTGLIFPLSPPPRQFNTEQSNYYNAMCGLSLYRGDSLGADRAGEVFVCESLSNLVTRRKLEPRGATFLSQRLPLEVDREFLASRDHWFHPVNLATGPDGGLYIADFYRELVEHPIYVADPQARAETDWRRGAECGRLWRIRMKNGNADFVARHPHLSQAPSSELVRLLEHPVGWWRDTAQRLLVERQDQAVVLALQQQLRQSPVPLARNHSLWTLVGMDALTETDLLAALADPHPPLRRQALRAMSLDQIKSPSLLAAVCGLGRETDEELRFQLAITARQLPTEQAISLMADLLNRPPSPELRMALLCSSTSVDPWKLVQHLLQCGKGSATNNDWRLTLIEQLAERQASQSTDESAAVVDWLLARGVEPISAEMLALLAGISRGIESRGEPFRTLVENPGSHWNRLEPKLVEFSETAFQRGSNLALPIEFRRQGTELFGRIANLSQGERLIEFCRAETTGPIPLVAVRAIVHRNQQTLFDSVFQYWPQFSTSVRQEFLDTIHHAPTGVAAVITALSVGVLTPNEISTAIRDAAGKHPDEKIRQQSDALLPTIETADRAAVIEHYRSSLSVRGNSTVGGALFKQHCLACHAIRGIGQRVGPDLAGVSSRRRDVLLVDILDPSRQVTPDFRLYTLVTQQGQVYSGLIAAETADSVTIRRERGEQQTFRRSEIESLHSSHKSVMPDGMEQKISRSQMSDLLEFLNRPETRLLTSE